jgi:hypothetical protein
VPRNFTFLYPDWCPRGRQRGDYPWASRGGHSSDRQWRLLLHIYPQQKFEFAALAVGANGCCEDTLDGDISVGEVDIDFDANGDVADVELAWLTKLSRDERVERPKKIALGVWCPRNFVLGASSQGLLPRRWEGLGRQSWERMGAWELHLGASSQELLSRR